MRGVSQGQSRTLAGSARFAFSTGSAICLIAMFTLEGLDHAALAVRDVERSANWYVEVFGFGACFVSRENRGREVTGGPRSRPHSPSRAAGEPREFSGRATRPNESRNRVSIRRSRNFAFDLLPRSRRPPVGDHDVRSRVERVEASRSKETLTSDGAGTNETLTGSLNNAGAISVTYF